MGVVILIPGREMRHYQMRGRDGDEWSSWSPMAWRWRDGRESAPWRPRRFLARVPAGTQAVSLWPPRAYESFPRLSGIKSRCVLSAVARQQLHKELR